MTTENNTRPEVTLDDRANEVLRLAGEGYPVGVDPDVADHMGAIEDDTMTLQEAVESAMDVDENDVVLSPENTPEE